MRAYPTQEDAQLLIDIMNRKSLYNGSCSPEFRKLGDKANDYPTGFIKLRNKTFGAKSPWSYKLNGRVEKSSYWKLFWNSEKAKVLGI